MKELQLFTVIFNYQCMRGEGVKSHDLLVSLGIPRSTFFRMIKVLINAGLIYRAKRGMYMINSAYFADVLYKINGNQGAKAWVEMVQ